MIAVVADDFTGAAELAGICLRYGLKVTLCTGEVLATDADVLIVSTDSRSMQRADALAIAKTLLEAIHALQPAWVYKKTDSVLRGYVLDELAIQMEVMQQSLAFLLPANPSLGRTIYAGNYFVNGQLISETSFAHDPEFPIANAYVHAMLGSKSVKMLTIEDAFPTAGIVVGEASTTSDINKWAGNIPINIALAGAGDFFGALLSKHFAEQPIATFVLQTPLIYVCGTSFDTSVEFIAKVHQQSDQVFYLPVHAFLNDSDIAKKWVENVYRHVQNNQQVIIAFDNHSLPSDVSALQLRTSMANAVAKLLQLLPRGELFIEGGSTAMAIFTALDMHQFLPLNEWERGAVRMQAGNWFVSVKPGSYALPAIIRQMFAP